MVQSDVKKLVAYSSVSHMGFIVLGLFAMNPQGVSGAVLQMVNHGVSTGALFILVGMIYERRHVREIDAFGGLAQRDAGVRDLLPDRDHELDRPARPERLRR